jgi:hypothetical protein
MRQKAKEKERKAAGLDPVVKKKQFKVEEHFDDCGQDLSGLGPDIEKLAADYLIEDASDISDEDLFLFNEYSVSASDEQV